MNICSKGPARKGFPPLKDIDLSPNKFSLVIPILATREFQSIGKILMVPRNPLERSLTVLVVLNKIETERKFIHKDFKAIYLLFLIFT